MKHLMIFAALGLGTASAQSLTVRVEPANSLEFGIHAGYAGGGNFGASVIARNVAGSSVGVRGTVDFTARDGFNDNAVVATSPSGTPITAGQLFGGLGFNNEANRNITVGLDALVHLGYEPVSGLGANAYVGGRYNLFSTTRSGASGSTTFSSNQFGLGGGLLASYPISGNVYLTGDLGVDYYFPANIVQTSSDGSSTTYVSGSADYNNTRAYINTPSTVLKAKVGLAVRF